MPETKFLKCACESCGGGIEFPAEGIGSTVPCPHCGWHTELKLENPVVQTDPSSRSLKWIIAGAVILCVGFVAIVVILVTARRMMEKARRDQSEIQAVRPAKTNPAISKPATPVVGKAINDFSISTVAIDNTRSLAYAAGTLKNETDKQRFGVTVELDLLDSGGKKIGTAKDYKDLIEPRAEWKFRALLVQKNVAAARVANVKEQE
jgi:hypothetical protein